jgi:hypothetical protein
VLPPTTPELLEPHKRPYFLWWLDCTVAELKARLESPDLAERAYYLGALLREATHEMFGTSRRRSRCDNSGRQYNATSDAREIVGRGCSTSTTLFPLEPLPVMLQPITAQELRAYRDALARRFKELSVRSP